MKKIDKFTLPKKCPYCKSQDIQLMTITDFYKGNFKKEGYLYVCLNCKARVGCHKGTTEPLGCLADDELRKMKIEIHSIIDQLWGSKNERKSIYNVLGNRYGHPFHVGYLDNNKASLVLADLKHNPL